MLSSVVVVWSGCGPMSNGSFRFQPPTWHLIPLTLAPLPYRSLLLNNCCVFFMTSNTLVKESAAMRVHPPRPAPPRKPDDQIAPHQLWSHLPVGQQQHARQVFIAMPHQLLAHRPTQPPTEEPIHDPRPQPDPSENN